jgi:hypothetical protein
MLVARLLALEAEVSEARKGPEGALRSSFDAMRLGLLLQQRATSGGHAKGLACEAIGRAGIWARLPRLDAPTAMRAARELESLAATKPAIELILERDRAAKVSALIRLTSSRAWRTRGFGPFFSFEEPARDVEWWYPAANYLTTLPNSRAGMVARIKRIENEAMQYARAPYPKLWPRRPIGKFDFFGRVLDADLNARVVANDVDTAQNALLTAALAVRAHMAAGKPPPVALRDLVGAGKLRKVPTDPFSAFGRPVSYAVMLDQPVIYSIGPDGADDGAVPITTDTAEGGWGRIVIGANTLGDIVAGQNGNP